ncbi:MAG: hypothetical protein ACTHW3_07600 [Leucobacter sp.]
MASLQVRNHVKRFAIPVGALIVVVVILWIDITSAVWQEVVILSGLAAGLVTFLLTVFVLDKVLARSTARRWAPVNRLAFTEFLHVLADDEHSEISRGHIVTRRLTQVTSSPGSEAYADELHLLRGQVVTEHRNLSDILSRWAQFLASSGDNETILLHVADIALWFDIIRDTSLEAEQHRDEGTHIELVEAVGACNQRLKDLTEELRSRLRAP